MAIQGDIRELKVSHPTLGNRIFKVKSNESNTFDRGGFRAVDDVNMITTDGEIIHQLNMQRGSLEVIIENDTAVRDDAGFLNRLAADAEDGVWQFTHFNSSVYSASGRPVGDIQPDLNTGSLTLKLGTNEWTKIV